MEGFVLSKDPKSFVIQEGDETKDEDDFTKKSYQSVESEIMSTLKLNSIALINTH